MASVLVIEDEPNLRTLLTRLLADAGYTVTAAATGASGLQAALSQRHDLIVLDLILPDFTGEEVLHILRASRPDERVLVLSSAPEIGRRVDVLERGAVDFLPKPFATAELLARVKARIRNDDNTPPQRRERRPIGTGMELDLQRRELIVDGNRSELSQREFVLLAHLLHRRGEVCTRQELLAGVWGIAFDTHTNVVDVYVRRLRAKLAADSIETVRNVGYRFVAC
ncbi:MAG: response regulator transcription factor [Jatrophihabitantaceae bacterium]